MVPGWEVIIKLLHALMHCLKTWQLKQCEVFFPNPKLFFHKRKMDYHLENCYTRPSVYKNKWQSFTVLVLFQPPLFFFCWVEAVECNCHLIEKCIPEKDSTLLSDNPLTTVYIVPLKTIMYKKMSSFIFFLPKLSPSSILQVIS